MGCSMRGGGLTRPGAFVLAGLVGRCGVFGMLSGCARMCREFSGDELQK